MGSGAKALLSYVAAPLLVSGIAAPAAADTTFPIRLADAEELTVVDNCPQGRYVVGFNAGSGQTGLDSVQIVCGELFAVGTGNLAVLGPVRGSSTRSDERSRCGSGGIAVSSFNVFRNADPRQVRTVTFTCAHPVKGTSELEEKGGDRASWTRSIGLDGAGEPDRRDKQECPKGELARGFTINYGDRIISMAMNCERFPIPVAATTPQSAPAVPPAPASAPNPAPGAAVAVVLAFQGGWQTVTDQNGHYTLVLQITNAWQYTSFADLYVTGQFFNTDGATQYNGFLQGVIPKGTRTLHYTYSQPEVKAGGKGQFTLSNDGNAITGTGTASDVTFTWNGTRAR